MNSIPIFRIVIALAVLSRASAETGGGGDRPLTPYPPNLPLTVEIVTAAKATAALNRQARVPRAAGTKLYENVFLAVERAGVPTIISNNMIATTGPSTNLLFDPSTIQEIRRLPDVNGQVQLEITSYPTLAPRDLIEKHPSYREIKANYTQTTKAVLNEDQGVLVLVTAPPGARVRTIARFRDLTVSSAISFAYLTIDEPPLLGPVIWFAIPSVTSDSSYPMRTVGKNL